MDEASAATWRFDRATTPWLRVVSYVVFGAFGGLLVTGLLARLRLVQRGQPLQAFVLLVALLAGPAVLLGGLRYARQFGDRSHGTDGTEGGEPAFRWRWVGVAALLQGTVAYALVSVGGTVGVAAIAGLFLLAFGGAFALNRLSTEGPSTPAPGRSGSANPTAASTSVPSVVPGRCESDWVPSPG